MAQGNGAWDFWIDRGGTFTDVIGVRPDRDGSGGEGKQELSRNLR
jgi:N-methylhydantoinase A/oxoprolinase/acetone carboxylase beta subunit